MTAPVALTARTVAALVGGRAAYRLAMYGCGAGLLAVWGAGEFAGYAAATGAVGWLFALISAGPEKAALALMPRPGGARLQGLFVLLATAPFAALVVTYAVFAIMMVSGPAPRYLAASAMTAGVGGCAVLVALYRLLGRPYADALAYAALALTYPLVLILAWKAGLGVDGVLAALLGGAAVVNTVLAVGLIRPAGPPASAETGHGSSVAATARAAATLGVGELLGAAAASVLFVILAIAADAAQTSWFYLLLIFSAAFSVGWSYLLRLAAPRMVAWLERHGRVRGWRVAGSLFGGAAALGGGLTAALIAFMWTSGGSAAQAWVALGLETALYACTTAALLFTENIDEHSRRWSAAGALAQLVTVAACGCWLVPVAGAAGAFAALCAGEVVKAALLHRVATTVRRIMPTVEQAK